MAVGENEVAVRAGGIREDQVVADAGVDGATAIGDEGVIAVACGYNVRRTSIEPEEIVPVTGGYRRIAPGPSQTVRFPSPPTKL